MLFAVRVLVATAGIAAAATGSPYAGAGRGARRTASLLLDPAAPDPSSSVVSVADYGAVPDGVTDNTAAFQRAIDALRGNASTAPGGVVWVPAGRWSFAGSLSLPRAVSLVGTYVTVPAHPVGEGGDPPTDGSIMMPRGGRGNADGPPFLVLGDSTTVRGLVFYYPDQLPTAAVAPYPWTIAMRGQNAAVLDVELLNSYRGINATGAPRHVINRVQGQPLDIGVFVDETYDIGRITDVHWNPWYSQNKAYMEHQTVHGRGFVFARTDWEYVVGTFVFGMSIGYHFITSPEGDGACNGNFVGIGADCCANASVVVDAADAWGILIVNGEFTSFSGGFGPDIADHTQIVVNPSNTGAVRISSSAFWGPSNQIAIINGSATSSVGFESCIFNAWDAVGQNRSAITVAGGNAFVRGCEFQAGGAKKTQLTIGAGARKVVAADNIVDGPLIFANFGGAGTRVAIHDNLGDNW